jgi:flagella basal body P-ring formation protein FlgA
MGRAVNSPAARRALARLLLSGALVAAAPATLAQPGAAPTPRIVIYPGEVIGDDMLDDAPPVDPGGHAGAIAETRSLVVGKMARRTLLPGRPIPLAAIDNPRLVAIGAQVRIVYFDGGLQIVTSGAALQDGAAGDFVKVRNSDSGIVVSGVVQPDGAVRIGGG